MRPGIAQSPDALAPFRASRRARDARAARALAERREVAWPIARRLAEILRTDFGATHVMLFGSLAHGHWYSSRSDIDLAAWGLSADEHLIALARMQESASGFRIDLVRMERCPDRLRAAIQAEGIDV